MSQAPETKTEVTSAVGTEQRQIAAQVAAFLPRNLASLIAGYAASRPLIEQWTKEYDLGMGVLSVVCDEKSDLIFGASHEGACVYMHKYSDGKLLRTFGSYG